MTTVHIDHVVRPEDLRAVHGFLSEESAWARGIPLETVERSVAHSLAFVARRADRLVGFARVVTDRATYAYLCDVFVLPGHRGQGISRRLMEAVDAHPALQGLRRMQLVTSSAGGLYAKFGYRVAAEPWKLMERLDPEIYTRKEPHVSA